jgi:hypothetical protein
LSSAEQVVDKAKGRVNSTTQQDAFDVNSILVFVNRNREVLGGEPITVLDSVNLKKKISPPVIQSTETSTNITLLERDIQNLSEIITEDYQRTFSEKENDLREFVDKIIVNKNLLRNLSCLDLIKLGL